MTGFALASSAHSVPPAFGALTPPSSSMSLLMQEDPVDPYIYAIDMDNYPTYQLVAKNDAFSLYYDSTTYNIAVWIEASGYAWFSVDPDYNGKDALTNRNHNQQTQNRIRSSIYYRTTQLDTISPERYLLNENFTITMVAESDGLLMHVHLTSANIRFTIEVRLTDHGFYYRVPFESVIEGDLRLQSLRIFPSFGATTGLNKKGYFFVPDGPGALIRYDNPAPGSAYSEDIYGDDEGYLTSTSTSSAFANILPSPSIRLPVIGGVQGIRKNAYIAVIQSGAEYAQIRSEIRNNVTKYFLNSFSFMYRQLYFRPTDTTGNGFRISPVDKAPFDIHVDYRFLSGDDADYVGMAKAYGETIDWGDVSSLEGMPLHLDFIGTEVYTGLLSKKTIVMTRYDDARSIVEDFVALGVKLHSVTFFGKDLDGAYAFGRRSSLGTKSDYERLKQVLDQAGTSLHHATEINYAQTTRGSVAKQLGGVSLRIASDSKVFPNHYLIDSLGWNRRFEDILSVVKKDGTGVDFAQTTGRSYTHINATRSIVYRNQMTSTMTAMLSMLSEEGASIALRNPNDIFLPMADAVLDAPLGGSGYPFVTDTVPFYQIAVGGRIPLFASALNFATNRDVYLLKMIEYGLYPSYILTEEDAFLLRGSDNLTVFTSQYAVWKDTILREYAQLAGALNPTLGSSIKGHRYLGQQVVFIEYDNGLKVYINYGDLDRTVDTHVIEAKNYLVVAGGAS
jgi:hypothetical protein